MLHAFEEGLDPARKLAARLGIELCPVNVHRFPDGESLVQVESRECVAVLYRSLDDPNAKLVELLLAASALRDNGAKRVILVAPYLAYMRQDIAFAPGQAVSQRVIGALLAAHFDGLLTVDPHLHRISSLAQVMPHCDAQAISAAPALAGCIKGAGNPVLIGPDAESRQWVEAIAAPQRLDFIVGEKRRLGDRQVELQLPESSKVKGRPAILVDDVISSGKTLEIAALHLLDAGATSVEALATHCLATEEDLRRLHQAGIAKIRSTDSIAGPTARIALADLLAEAIALKGWLEQAG